MPLSIPKFVLFGDSITQHSSDQSGFALAPALQNLYQRKMDIVTRGFSGYNTDHGLVVLREVLKHDGAADGHIKLMYLFMGTNDAALTFQKVEPEKFRENLLQMARLVLLYGIKLIVIGPGLHDQALSTVAFESEEPFLSSRRTRQYADIASEVSAQLEVPFIDLWTIFQKYGGWTTQALFDNLADLAVLLSDGIHYTPKAYEIMYEEIVSVISGSYPELLPDNMKQVFPYYADIDVENIEKSLLESIE